MNVQNEVIEETADTPSIIKPTNNNTFLERANTVCDTKKSKKIAKLENILGTIKNKVQNKFENNERVVVIVANDISKNESVANSNISEICDLTNGTNDHDELNHNLKETNEENQLKNNENDVTKNRDSPIQVDDTKRRKISTSGSDMSVNDEDLLKNLENINIPIYIADTDEDKDDTKKSKDDEPKADTNVKDLQIQNTNKSTNEEVARLDTVDIDSTERITTQKDILKRLAKQTEDILDVRLLKIPTNATNQVKVWSKIENIQRHNLKLEDFDKSFDIEDELVFSMIKCNNKIDPETIYIDDDDDEPMEDAIDLDAIGKVNDKIDSNFTDLAEIILVNDDQETVTIRKESDVRLIETPVAIDEIKETQVSVDVMTKPKHNNQAVIKRITNEMPKQKDVMTNPNQNWQAVLKPIAIELPKPNKEQSNNQIRGVRILPASEPISNTNKMRTKSLIQKDTKEKTNRKNKGVKIIKTKTDKIIRIKDIDISIIKENANIERNKTREVKNDLRISLIKNDGKSDKETDKRIEVPSKTTVILPPLKKIAKISNRSDKETNQSLLKPSTLPSLTKHPKINFESPKSIYSISSDTTEPEGTISDTNIQFLDEYDEDRRSADITSEGETTDVCNTDIEMKGTTKNKETKNVRKKQNKREKKSR